jgi:hypothetical protein
MNPALPVTPAFLPYSTLHYMLEDILYLFKQAMFRFGWRHYPDIMATRNWSILESGSIVDFMQVMATNAHFKMRINFCEKEFGSLRLLLNAHAHGIGDFDVDQVVALLDDACVDARAFRLFRVLPRLRQYQEHLQEYKQRIGLKTS